MRLSAPKPLSLQARHPQVARVICVGGMVAALAMAQQPALDAESHRQLADGLYARGMYALAASEYESLLKSFPDTLEMDACQFRLGECYRSLGETASAEKAYRAVFTKYPESEFRFKACFQRANIFLSAERPAAAVDLFGALLAMGPPQDIAAASLFFMGEAYLDLDKRSDARGAFQTLADTYKESEYYAYALLKLSALLGANSENPDPQKSLQLLETANAHARTDRIRAEALFQLAERHFELAEYEKSAQYYQSIFKTFPKDLRVEQARLRAAWASHNAGRYAEALETAEAAMSTATIPDWLYLKANSQRQLGQGDQAVKSYQALLASFPESKVTAAARYELALTFFRLAQYENAIATLESLPPDAPARKEILWLLAESHAALEHHNMAIQSYRLLVREFPESETACEANYRVAYQLQNSKNLLEASRYYLEVVDACPGHALHVQALYAAGHCLAAEEKHADAIAAWSALLKDFGSSEYAEESLYRKAMSEIHLKRNAAALTSLYDLVKQFPQSGFLADAHYWIGMMLLSDNQLHDADNAFQSSIDAAPRADLLREAQYQRAVVLHRLEKYDGCAALIQPLLASPIQGRLTPGFLEWLCMYRLGRKEPQLAIVPAQILADKTDSPDAQQLGWCLVGRCHKAAGKTEDMAKAYARVLAIKEGNLPAAEAALAIGDYHLEKEDAKTAISDFGKAASWAHAPSAQGIRARAYVGLGRAYKAMQQRDEAARYFMSVAVLYDDPEVVPECLFRCAEIYAALGQIQNAGKSMDELRQRYPDSEWAKRSMQEAPGP